MAAPQSFVALFDALNIPVEDTKKKIEHFFQDACVATPSNNAINHLKEEAASLVWACDSISNGADPDLWINYVGPAVVALLRTLCPRCPQHHPWRFRHQAPSAVHRPLHGGGLHPRPTTANPDATSAHRRRHQHHQDLVSSHSYHNDALYGGTRVSRGLS